MSGPDPKERIQILEILDRASVQMNHDRFGAAVPLLEAAAIEDPTNPAVYSHWGCVPKARTVSKGRRFTTGHSEQGGH